MLKSEGFYLCLLFCCSDVECDDSVILLEDENEGDSLASATPELGHSRNVFSSQFGAPGSSRSIGPSSEGRESHPVVKVPIDSDDIWADMLALYKNCADDFLGKRIRVTLNESPVIDTCGVRKHVYTSVFAEFVNNKHVRLFDGPPNYVRPLYSAEARCSGLFKVLRTMVGHSIILDGIRFPYFSPVWYWYIVSGEEKALEYVNISDVGKDTAYAVTKVQFM